MDFRSNLEEEDGLMESIDEVVTCPVEHAARCDAVWKESQGFMAEADAPIPHVRSAPSRAADGPPTAQPAGVHGINGEGNVTETGKKRTRGHGNPKKGWNSGKQVFELAFNEWMQVISLNQPSFASQLGLLVKDGTKFPLIFKSWRKKGMRPYKDSTWAEIKRNTGCPEEFREVCMKDLGHKWRSWKARVKQEHYMKYATDVERLANCPPRVLPTQWPILVKWFGSKDAKARSERNKSNRGKLEDPSRTGRRSHALIRQKRKAKGKRYDRVAIYMKTHKSSNKTTANRMDQMDAIVAQVEEPERTPELYEKAFTEVMGPDGHGRVRLMGVGPSPGQVHGVSSSRGSLRVNYAEAVDELRTTIRAELETDMESRMDAALKRQEADMLAREAAREAERKTAEAAREAERQTAEAAREAERQAAENAREAAYEAKVKRLESLYARLEAVPAAPPSHQKEPATLTKKRIVPNPARTTAKTAAKTSKTGVCPSTATKTPYVDKVGGLKLCTVLSTDTPVVEVATGILSDYSATLHGKRVPANCTVLQIETATLPLYKLYITTYSDINTIGDAIGKLVVWPTSKLKPKSQVTVKQEKVSYK